MFKHVISSALIVGLILVPAARAENAGEAKPFRIFVRDHATGRGVPLVELTMTNQAAFITDNAGMIAFSEPGLMNTRVHFTIQSHGYEYPADGFNIRGVALDITPGGSATLDINRVNIAERLYRITGSGLYRDSVLLGDDPPIENALINGLVNGQDSIQSIVYNDRIYWFWGDTSRPAYPLGNFHMSGATSEQPPPNGTGLDPSVGIDLDYFVNNDGFSRGMIPMNEPGPVWADGFMIIPDDSSGRMRMLCHWARIKSLGEIYERGLAMYHDDKKIFESFHPMDVDSSVHPFGHPVELMRNGEHVYAFGSPFPCMYVQAKMEAITDPSAYRSFTPFLNGADGELADTLERNRDGRIVYGWKNATKPIEMREMTELRQAGQFKAGEQWFDLRDVETGRNIYVHGGSVAWNPYRQKWITILLESFGESSLLGEIWYSEADTPMGPWVWARRIVTHDKYSFYNPKHHPFLDQDGGRVIYFEGTYTHTFSAAPTPTPRYDYNQIMYRLSLDDRRLHLPGPVYVMANGRLTMRDHVDAGVQNGEVEDVAFFAISPGDETDGMVPMYLSLRDGEFVLSLDEPEHLGSPLCYGYPVDHERMESDLIALVPLYEFTLRETGARRHSTQESLGDEWMRGDAPVCFVWENRIGAEVIAPLIRAGLEFRQPDFTQ